MKKKDILFLGSLLLGCQEEKLQTLEQLAIPDIFTVPNLEAPVPTNKELVKFSSPKPSEQKTLPEGIACTIDLSNRFIPELMSLSRDAKLYFSADGILHNPFQRERLGIFSSFEHHQLRFHHYAKAIERRGSQKQPKIEFFFRPYTSEKMLKAITSLEQQLLDQKLSGDQREKLKSELEKLQKQILEVKGLQQILQWEDYYNGEITGLYDTKTLDAVRRYQIYHRARLINPYMHINSKLYELKADGNINKPTRELLNTKFEKYAFEGAHRVLEERVFHAKCGGKYPYVIEPKELDKLVQSAAEQLNLHTVEGMQDFFSAKPGIATVYLNIPERYRQESMKLEIEVEKWEKDRRKSKLRLYSVDNGKKIELISIKAVVGGRIMNKKAGRRKNFNTPERKFYLKHVTILPHWNPPGWAAQERIVKEERLPGPFNAFGMLNAPLYYDKKPQNDPFRAWQEADKGYRIHLTPWPSSVENGGVSHGCIRIHPNLSRFFYFITGYTPHQIALEDFQGKKTLKFTASKGSFIPFEPEHYIKARVCDKNCK